MSVTYSITIRRVPAWPFKVTPDYPATDRPGDPPPGHSGFLTRSEFLLDWYKKQEQWDKDNELWLSYEARYLLESGPIEWGAEEFRWRVEHTSTGYAELVLEEEVVATVRDMVSRWNVGSGDVALCVGQWSATIQKELSAIIYTDQTGLRVNLYEDYDYELFEEIDYSVVLEPETGKPKLSRTAQSPGLTGIQYTIV